MSDYDEIKSIVEAGNKTLAAMADEIQNTKSRDAIYDDKIKKMEADLAETIRAKNEMENRVKAMEALANRPVFDSKSGEQVDEVKAAWNDFLRKKGSESATAAYIDVLKKADIMSTTVGENGGYLVPQSVSTVVTDIAKIYSPLRGLARVVPVGTPEYREVLNQGGTTVKWVGGETAAREKTEPSKLKNIVPAWGEMSTNVSVTERVLNDSFFDLAGFIASEMAYAFAKGEGEVFLRGTGVAQPKGLLEAKSAANTIKSGVAADITAEKLIEVSITGVAAEYRANATWIMSSIGLARIATLADTTGRSLVMPSMQVGAPLTLLGRPIAIDENMDAVAAGKVPFIYGDISRAYLITDIAQTTSVLPNPYLNQGFVEYWASRRVGGTPKDTAAVSFITCAV